MLGMQMQMEQECEKCGGRGIIFSEVCPHCKGRKIVREKKKLTVEIEKGMENGQKIQKIQTIQLIIIQKMKTAQ